MGKIKSFILGLMYEIGIKLNHTPCTKCNKAYLKHELTKCRHCGSNFCHLHGDVGNRRCEDCVRKREKYPNSDGYFYQ